ncbi:nucleotidyltransferase substrate binding protein [Roseiflexus sp. RS-1]|jgi:nucleotidyltransferase substrate binding protein (TIGR01987 family)|uniref:nucleotidyltransferase substrate binding protein n=1 Tax=Roseiflexus sp. (strain RS-1) TaxID=357808 RepID=UPI0000D80EA3|nr:nucleotidyltransferase substrate binding protein [Roseiflexus sp. RS-1]ABQ91864.1 nucleotidyltransferase substrate binding protein, HI0074 family [Roseiflexus sp. RS-1]
MNLDLSSLSQAIQSLDAALRVVDDRSWFDAQRSDVQQTLIAGVVQNFEFVYELCIKMIRRRLEIDAASPSEIDFINFRDMMRTAAEKGLIADVDAWFGYRQLRNMTAHTYDAAKAQSVCQRAHDLLTDAQAVLRALEMRNV